MKKLYIMRHAKANEPHSTTDDFDRELSSKGIEDASFIGKLLNTKNTKIDLMISSPAKRTIQTSKIVAQEINYTKNIEQNTYIYEAYVNALEEIISYISNENDTVLLIGHNPGIAMLAYTLSGSKTPISPASIIEIDFETDDWARIAKELSKIISFETP